MELPCMARARSARRLSLSAALLMLAVLAEAAPRREFPPSARSLATGPAFAAAYRRGSTGPATRFLLEEAARPTRARRLTLGEHTDKLWDLAYSPDGRWLATASSDRTARIWDAVTGAPRAVVHHDGGVVAVAFSPDSRLLASGGADRAVHVWDVSTGREAFEVPASEHSPATRPISVTHSSAYGGA